MNNLKQDLQTLYTKYGFDRIITRMKLDIQEKYPDTDDLEEIRNIHYALDGIEEMCYELELQNKKVL